MKRSVIVDVDDTLSDTKRHILLEVERQFGVIYHFDDETLEMREGQDEAYDKHISQILTQPEVMAATQPYPQAVAALERLKKAGYEMHIVSARKEVLHDITMSWLQNHGFLDHVAHIHPRPSHKKGKVFKREVAQRLNAIALFDDTLDVVLELAEVGVAGYLIDKPWNRVSAKLPSNVHRVPDFVSGVDKFLGP